MARSRNLNPCLEDAEEGRIGLLDDAKGANDFHPVEPAEHECDEKVSLKHGAANAPTPDDQPLDGKEVQKWHYRSQESFHNWMSKAKEKHLSCEMFANLPQALVTKMVDVHVETLCNSDKLMYFQTCEQGEEPEQRKTCWKIIMALPILVCFEAEMMHSGKGPVKCTIPVDYLKMVYENHLLSASLVIHTDGWPRMTANGTKIFP